MRNNWKKKRELSLKRKFLIKSIIEHRKPGLFFNNKMYSFEIKTVLLSIKINLIKPTFYYIVINNAKISEIRKSIILNYLNYCIYISIFMTLHRHFKIN